MERKSSFIFHLEIVLFTRPPIVQVFVPSFFFRSGTYEMTELQELLTSVAQLEEVKPDKEVKALYSRKDRSEAEAIRSEALALVQDSDSEDDNSNLNARSPIVNSGSSNVNADNSNAVRNVVNSNHSNRGLLSAHLNSNDGPSSYQRPNVKRELVSYLERKAEVTGILIED